MSAIAGQVLVRLCYCTFLFGKDKQWYTSRPKTQGRRSAQSKRECLHVRVCICVCVCLSVCACTWMSLCCLRSGIPLKHGEAYKWAEFFSHALLNHETNAGKVSGRAMLIYLNSWYANGVWFCFFSLELITGVTSANEIIQYPAFCRILWHFSLSLGMKLMEQILQSPRLGDLG